MSKGLALFQLVALLLDTLVGLGLMSLSIWFMFQGKWELAIGAWIAQSLHAIDLKLSMKNLSEAFNKTGKF